MRGYYSRYKMLLMGNSQEQVALSCCTVPGQIERVNFMRPSSLYA